MKNQTDLFDGGATGGDTTFSLASTTGQDFAGHLDRLAADEAAKRQAAAAQSVLQLNPN